MKPRTINLTPNKLRAAVVGSMMLAASGVASAAPVTLNLDFQCPFPLIGSQLIKAKISADYPAEQSINAPLGPIAIDTITVVNDPSRQGLALVGAVQVTGTATSFNTIVTPKRNIAQNTLLTVVPTAVPSTSGAFDVPAKGTAEAVTLNANDLGAGKITVNDLVLNLKNYKADGSVAPAPIGEFTADCTLVAGQNNTLATFTFVDSVTPPPPPPPVEDPAEISLDATSLNFGTVLMGQTAQRKVTVSNTGGEALGVNGVSIEGAGAAAFVQSNNCTTVAAGASCDVNVTFNASEEGAKNATLKIASDDATNPNVSVALAGVGQLQPMPEIGVSGASVDFGSIEIGTSADRTITVTNSGTAALNVTDASLANNDAFVIKSTSCDIVAPGASCAIVVTYTAASSASASDTLTIASNDEDEAVVTVALTGKGSEPVSTIFPIAFSVEGSTYIAKSKNTLPLVGVIDSQLDLMSGQFDADLLLEPTSSTFPVIQGFNKLTATANVEFENVGKTTGSIVDGKLTATSKAYVKVPKVTGSLFGIKLTLGGGANCKTKEVVSFTVTSPEGQTFQPMGGGVVEGVYSLPALQNCGLLTSVLNQFLTGDGNTISLGLVPVQE